MGFMQDYLWYASGDECPTPYKIWSGYSLLGAVLGRKVWTFHGDYFMVLPNLYVCLVGDAGSGKSTAKNVAKKIITKAFPNYPTSASFQSHQDIIDQMCNAEPHLWKDEAGIYFDKVPQKLYDYRPFYLISNELASLLSTDKKGMVEFLVDIYDENEFSTGFKTQRNATPDRKQKLENPYVSLLCCAVPKWFMGNLKLDLFDGGLGRRLIIVSANKEKLVDDPRMPEGAKEAFNRAVEHLREAEALVGPLKRTPAAMSWWKQWYHDPKRKSKDDPILMQFDETKPIQALKIAMLTSLCERPFKMVITDEHLQIAVAMLDSLVPNILRLTSGIGRNELAGVGTQLLDFLERTTPGYATEMHVKKFFVRYARTGELQEILNHFVTTAELVMKVVNWGGIMKTVYVLPDREKDFDALILEQQKRASGGSTAPSPGAGPA